MENNTGNLVVLITHGIDDELSTVGFTIANGAITNGLNVSMFLTSGGVDLLRKKAIDTTQVEPFETLKSLVASFLERGGTIWACAPCVKSRGYTQEDLLEGVIITGAGPMLGQIKEGAATLSF